jgi:4-hydroxybenzoate polyprenyltransferase
MNNVKGFIFTFRLHMIPIVLITLLFGMLSSGQTISTKEIILIFLLSVSAHVFGFGLNDWLDFSYDKNNPRHLERSMLLSGKWKFVWHKVVTLIQLPLCMILTWKLGAENQTIVLLLFSAIFISLYNIFSKKAGKFIILIDLCFPTSLVMLFLSGFSLKANLTDLDVYHLLLIISLFTSMLLANTFLAGSRDIDSDFNQDASSVLALLGCTVNKPWVHFSTLSRIVAQIIYLINVPSILLLLFLKSDPWFHYLLVIILLFNGWMHLFILMRMKELTLVAKYDSYTAMAYLFYAAAIPWMYLLPKIFWVVIAFNLLYPLIFNKEGRYGRSSFKAIFQS